MMFLNQLVSFTNSVIREILLTYSFTELKCTLFEYERERENVTKLVSLCVATQRVGLFSRVVFHISGREGGTDIQRNKQTQRNHPEVLNRWISIPLAAIKIIPNLTNVKFPVCES